MTKNIVILTHGWTGSSLFAALFGKAGYWLGDNTVQKPDYDTFENAELVSLNQALLQALAPDINHEHRFSFADVTRIANDAETIDLKPYRDFVARCAPRGPWLWKDPRLTWTIRVWAKVLDLERTAFLILTRDDLQAWISSNQRRHIQSMRFTRQYNHGVTRSNGRFLDDLRLSYLAMSFEDLTLRPETSLDRLSEFFEVGLSMSDLRAVSSMPLGRKSRDWTHLLMATLIYVKNYGERDGHARLAEKAHRNLARG